MTKLSDQNKMIDLIEIVKHGLKLATQHEIIAQDGGKYLDDETLEKLAAIDDTADDFTEHFLNLHKALVLDEFADDMQRDRHDIDLNMPAVMGRRYEKGRHDAYGELIHRVRTTATMLRDAEEEEIE